MRSLIVILLQVIYSCIIGTLSFIKIFELYLFQIMFKFNLNKRKDLEQRIRSIQEKLIESNTESVLWKEKFETLERDSSPASKE